MKPLIITAGAAYLDIDAYACCVALAELLQKQGKQAIAYSAAPCNYSVCDFLTEDVPLLRQLPAEIPEDAQYIIVDVSDPVFLQDCVPLQQIVAIYDHHPGFEAYWKDRLGAQAHIEFIGAAATLIYRAWQEAGLQAQMSDMSAKLLSAAILDNTLNLTSANTSSEDIAAFESLCSKGNFNSDFRAEYFSQVQKNVEADLKYALLNDIKTITDNQWLPGRIGQLCVWDADRILTRLPEIRGWFSQNGSGFFINLIDIQHQCSYFICDDAKYQEKIGRLFGIRFSEGFAKTDSPWLRKEIIKKALQTE